MVVKNNFQIKIWLGLDFSIVKKSNYGKATKLLKWELVR